MPIEVPARRARRHRCSLDALLLPHRLSRRMVPHLTFEEALARVDIPFNALAYIISRGHRIESFDDLLDINDAFRNVEGVRFFAVREGVAVSTCDGLMWFVIDEPQPISRRLTA